MKIEIDFDNKTICIKTPGMTLGEIEAMLAPLLKDWKDYKLISDVYSYPIINPITPVWPISPIYRTDTPFYEPFKITCKS